MAAVAYTLYIPRANFKPGTGATAINMFRPGDVGRNIVPTSAQEHGTRGPFVADTTLWSTLTFKANSPNKTVGRQVQLVGDAAWALTSFATEAAFANAYPIAANTPFTIELNREDEILYFAASSGSVNVHAWVVR
jgi:hypothetical protein